MGFIINPYRFVAGEVGGWVELARTTLTGTSTTIDVSSIPDKRYYMVLLDFRRSGTNQCGMRINGDSGSNYARRFSYNSTSESTGVNESSFDFTGNGSSAENFAIFNIYNKSTEEKIIIDTSNERGDAGAGSIGDYRRQVSKWVNTSDSLDQLTAILSASTYASGSEMVVLGWNEDDSHTTNFWEELASVDGITTSTKIDSGTFTAKKYLWIQSWWQGTSGTDSRFNSDSDSDYSMKLSTNGASMTSSTDQTSFLDNFGFSNNIHYMNFFVLNDGTNNKLGFWNINGITTTGAGIPSGRNEGIFKYVDTAQITSFQLDAQTGTYSDGGIRVWGSN